MTETTETTVPAATASTVLEYELPNIDGKRSFDCASIPAETRLDLLKTAVRGYLANRVNAAHQRHQKLEAVTAWEAFDAASKADPLQTLVPKPEGDRPVAPDLVATLNGAIADLVAGNIRKMGTGTKTRERKDPLIAMVTKTVVKEVYEGRHAVDSKFTYIMAGKEVGTDGVAYLNNLIETKVAAGVSRTDLEKMLEERYMKPARLMLGIDKSKAMGSLPSIL